MPIASHMHDDTKGAFAVLWSWLRRSASPAPAQSATCAAADPVADAALGAVRDQGVVLPFPLRGEALMVRLADLLRRRVDELVPRCERLSLVLSHCPQLRLSIDDSAYVEFDASCAEFHLVIEAPSGTRMIIETTDFDAVVKFVLQYVVEKLSDDAGLEAAS